MNRRKFISGALAGTAVCAWTIREEEPHPDYVQISLTDWSNAPYEMARMPGYTHRTQAAILRSIYEKT